MKLHPPFIITSRLLPGLRIGDAVLHLDGVKAGREVYRTAAKMILDLPWGVSHKDDTLQSGHGGFGGAVTIFESYLGFLSYAAERETSKQQKLYPDDGDGDLFPPDVTQWAADNKDEIDACLSELQDESGGVLHNLIEEG